VERKTNFVVLLVTIAVRLAFTINVNQLIIIAIDYDNITFYNPNTVLGKP